MAKRRMKVKRARRSYFAAKTRRRSSGSSMNLPALAITGAVYGFGRQYLENLISPITARFPLAGYADEIVLGGVGYLAAKGKFGNNKMLKNAGTVMLIVESVRAGSSIGTQSIGTKTSSVYDY